MQVLVNSEIELKPIYIKGANNFIEVPVSEVTQYYSHPVNGYDDILVWLPIPGFVPIDDIPELGDIQNITLRIEKDNLIITGLNTVIIDANELQVKYDKKFKFNSSKYELGNPEIIYKFKLGWILINIPLKTFVETTTVIDLD